MKVLSEGSIHLWLAYDETIKDQSLLDEYQEWLGPDERGRYQRISSERQKHQYLVTRALVRSVLSLYAPEVGPAQWVFDKNDYGKPFIRYPNQYSSLRFNLSHTEKLVVLAVTSGPEVGVDAEWTQRSGFTPALAEHYFAEVEVEALRSFSGQKADRIFDLWTLKEAYIKARGLGLSIALRDFAYDFIGDEQLDISFSNISEDHPDRWRMWLFSPGQQHRVALAVTASTHPAAYCIEKRECVPGSTWRYLDLAPSRRLNAV